ncbi:glycosyltransferase [Roseomonas xinghualingensis]|uniref:glycosyltransferase n=1 Tax=Roseomonas xinghualingensis TaxID=2986475 RepID=UPI0021F2421F|nr:glycosyltransferase [Roseomonas sp. SXEYE001]MCV4209130.1 glycosyltransferase [Roseomonas sp. SXEYE001]
MRGPRIAVLIPCHNEEAAIPGVVAGFRAVLPDADIYVYDNNSTDRTRELAAAAGALVRTEPLQGKGNVVRRMFADVEADAYLLVDGDGTYDPSAAPAMIAMLQREQLDMVTGVRVSDAEGAYRRGHRFGNLMLTGVVRGIFGNRATDMLSGYRCFSRRFVKSFPALARGFETETEFTVHALELRLPIAELSTAYGERPAGSVSKLRTYRDGFRILRMIISLVQREKPLLFFGVAALGLAGASLILLAPVLETFLRTGLVPRLPTFVASLSLMMLSFLSLACGLVLDTVTRGRLEAKRIAYLALSAPPGRSHGQSQVNSLTQGFRLSKDI